MDVNARETDFHWYITADQGKRGIVREQQNVLEKKNHVKYPYGAMTHEMHYIVDEMQNKL